MPSNFGDMHRCWRQVSFVRSQVKVPVYFGPVDARWARPKVHRTELEAVACVRAPRDVLFTETFWKRWARYHICQSGVRVRLIICNFHRRGRRLTDQRSTLTTAICWPTAFASKCKFMSRHAVKLLRYVEVFTRKKWFTRLVMCCPTSLF